MIFWSDDQEKVGHAGELFGFFCASGKYKFIRRLTKRAETANYFSANQNLHPISTALVSSKMNTTGTKTFTSEWVLFGRLIITM